MRTVRGIGLALVVGLLGATTGSAQEVWGSAPFVSQSGSVTYSSAPMGVISGGPVYGISAVPDGGVIYPYSYAVTAPLPARGYVGYGASDIFPYHGRPYGHAYDKYSWSTLSGSGSMARYYYPPVR